MNELTQGAASIPPADEDPAGEPFAAPPEDSEQETPSSHAGAASGAEAGGGSVTEPKAATEGDADPLLPLVLEFIEANALWLNALDVLEDARKRAEHLFERLRKAALGVPAVAAPPCENIFQAAARRDSETPLEKVDGISQEMANRMAAVGIRTIADFQVRKLQAEEAGVNWYDGITHVTAGRALTIEDAIQRHVAAFRAKWGR